jgi:hypothetical protein
MKIKISVQNRRRGDRQSYLYLHTILQSPRTAIESCSLENWDFPCSKGQFDQKASSRILPGSKYRVSTANFTCKFSSGPSSFLIQPASSSTHKQKMPGCFRHYFFKAVENKTLVNRLFPTARRTFCSLCPAPFMAETPGVHGDGIWREL